MTADMRVFRLFVVMLVLASCQNGRDDPPVLLLGDPPRNWTYEGSDVYVVHVRRGLAEITPAFHAAPWPEGMYPRLVAPGPLPCYAELGPVQTFPFGRNTELAFRIPVMSLKRPVVVGFKVEWLSQPSDTVRLVGPPECD